MKLYKLTDTDGRTRGDTQWGPGITHRAMSGSKCAKCGGGLCTHHYIHAYLDPLLAILLNPIHAEFDSPRLWLAEGRIARRDGQLKIGCKQLTTIEELSLPAITTEQLVRCAILVVKQVYHESSWNQWAEKWLSGDDRTVEAARAAAAEAMAVWVEATAVEAVTAALRAVTAAERVAEAAEMAERVAGAVEMAERAAEEAEEAEAANSPSFRPSRSGR